MKKIALIGAVLLSISIIQAQTITIEKTYRAFEEKGYNPKLNADGTLLVYTSDSYKGLSIYNFADKSTLNISNEQGAGYAPIFGKDNIRIFYKTVSYQSKLRNEAVQSYDLSKKVHTEMIQPRRDVKQLQPLENGIMVYADKKIYKTTFGKTKAPINDYVWSDGNNLNIFKDGKKQILNPVEGANGYVWASLSPDGKQILFTATAKGTYVCDLNGKITANLGYLNAPTWYDNNYVVGMQDKDDGHFVTESKIIIKSIDGKTQKELSSSHLIAMYPTTSSAAGKIAFNTASGEIYIVEISVK